MRAFAGLTGLLACLAFAAPAQAEIGSVFDGQVTCTTADDGVRECGGDTTTVPTFDGVPVDVNVAFPPAPVSGTDSSYPLVGVFHGWGGSKIGFGNSGSSGGLRRWTSQGYAAFSMSDRGWGDTCGGLSPTRLDPACAQGWIRLMDTRYEVRDAQELIGMLVDDGAVDPQRIGTTGGSYGGGISMALAALRDRKMMPDDQLVPWTSPDRGTPMRIAAAAPEIPWTDLAYSLQPNGRTLDYVADAPYNLPIGIVKASFVAGLYALGQASGFYAPPGVDQDADLTGWYALINAGEPYDSNPLTEGIVDEIKTHHSSYYVNPTEAPAPLLISNGWTDDLFPPDEAIRFYNRTRTRFSGADISLFFLSYGHQRGQNKPPDVAQLHAAQDAWFAHFLRGDGPLPFEGVTTLTQTCPDDAASGGPYTAPTWAAIAPGEVRLDSAAAQTIQPIAGDPSIGLAFDPVAGDGACATASGDDQTGAATFRLPAAPAGGYTLMGSPTVIADLDSSGPHSQIAARLLDVAPTGEETLVGRGLYRVVESSRQVFQLHPNGWKFAEGHVPKLELLPNDAPYSRPTNGQAPVTVSNLELRLPVLEQPGAAGGAVQAPAPKVVPPGYELAIDYRPPAGAAAASSEDAKKHKKGCAGADPRRGSGGNDKLKGTKNADRLYGRGGDDRLAGRRGADCLRGGSGDDVLVGGPGHDRIGCGSGEDTVVGPGGDKLAGCERTRRLRR